MDVRAIDHVTLHVPEDGVAPAVDFYRDRLGFDIERMESYEAGEKPFFDVRLAPDHVLHLWPDEDFEAPPGTGYNHVALVVDAGLDELRDHLDAVDVDVEQVMEAPVGAAGTAPAVYVRDPFGYRVELKTS